MSAVRLSLLVTAGATAGYQAGYGGAAFIGGLY